MSEPAAGLYGRLVTSKLLADELKLTGDQKGKLTAAFEPIQKAEREASKLPRPKSIDERREREAAGTNRQAEMKAVVGEVLTPDQVRRLTQIAYQTLGWSAFTFQEVRDGVKMTPAQVETFVVVLDGHMARQSELLRPPPPAPGGAKPTPEETRKRLAERQEKLNALGKETLGKIEAALTDEQKKAWKAMTGPAFDLAKFGDETARPKPKDK